MTETTTETETDRGTVTTTDARGSAPTGFPAPDTVPSTLIAGFNHVAAVTRDLDRLTAFYADVFDAPFIELTDPRGRHGFVRLGGPTAAGDLGPVLHVFEVPVEMTGPFPSADEMFRRGRLDHIAIQAAGEAELRELRDRLVARGACDGVVRLFDGWFLSVHVVDPDGMRLEVGCERRGDGFADDELEPVA